MKENMFRFFLLLLIAAITPTIITGYDLRVAEEEDEQSSGFSFFTKFWNSFGTLRNLRNKNTVAAALGPPSGSTWSIRYPTQEELHTKFYEANQRSLTSPRTSSSSEEPPFYGTVYIDSDIITTDSPTTYTEDETYYLGKRIQHFYDQKQEKWKEGESYIYRTYFSDGIQIEFWVHADALATEKDVFEFVHRVGYSLGQMPQFLRRGVKAVQILNESDVGTFSANSDGIINIHVQEFETSLSGGYLEETLLHEMVHTTLDKSYYEWVNWEDAVENDPGYISYYAEDAAMAEDVSESMTNWIGIVLGTLNDEDVKKTLNQIPHRLQLFDNQNFDLYPLNNGGINPSVNYVGTSVSSAENYKWKEPIDFYYPKGKALYDVPKEEEEVTETRGMISLLARKRKLLTVQQQQQEEHPQEEQQQQQDVQQKQDLRLM